MADKKYIALNEESGEHIGVCADDSALASRIKVALEHHFDEEVVQSTIDINDKSWRARIVRFKFKDDDNDQYVYLAQTWVY